VDCWLELMNSVGRGRLDVSITLLSYGSGAVLGPRGGGA